MTIGQLIILEGADGTGKSTASKLIAEHLRGQGESVSCFAFPGQHPGTLGKLVHELHHEPERHGIIGIDPAGLQVLHAAAHVDAIRARIQPALERGETIIMDRFWWSTIVYGRMAGVDDTTLALLRQLAEHHWRFARRAAAFVLMGAADQTTLSQETSLLQTAYREFVAEFDGPYPVYMLDDVTDPADYPRRILGELARLRHSPTE